VELALGLFALSILTAILTIAFSAEDIALPPSSKQRAYRLFLSQLNANQRASWLRYREFEVAAASGRRYTLSTYGPFNIRSRDEAFCLRVGDNVPVYDKLLAQHLLVRTDERLFLRLANSRRLSPH
jgi:hypothetical protein